MAKANVTVMTCDRCRAVEECRRVEQEYEWGRILAAQANGPFRIGTPTQKVVFPEGGKDICPACIKSLRNWWETGACDEELKPADFPPIGFWRHRKRGTFYTVIAEAELQQAGQFGPVEGDKLVIYRGDDGKVWARAASEFHDGRFTHSETGA